LLEISVALRGLPDGPYFWRRSKEYIHLIFRSN